MSQNTSFPADFTDTFPQLGSGELLIEQRDGYEALVFKQAGHSVVIPIGHRATSSQAFRMQNSYGSTGLAEAVAATGIGYVANELGDYAYLVIY